MKLFLITDIHNGKDVIYPKDINKPELGTHTSTFHVDLSAVSTPLKEAMNSCDIAINLGDLIVDVDSKTNEEQYRNSVENLQSNIPVKHVFGNHDVKNISKEKLKEITGTDLYYSFDFGGFHHIVLSCTPSWDYGPAAISEEEYSWFKNDVNKTELKTIVYCHFPIDNQSLECNPYFNDKPERAFVSNKIFIRNIISNSGKIVAVFSGHTHYAAAQSIDGVSYFTIPSFAENNGEGEPSLQYGLCEINNKDVKLEIKKLA